MSIFITFEGGEGSGKTVQSKLLLKRLTQLDLPVLLTHEPGGTVMGARIRRWLKQGRGTPISAMAELLMFNASRAQLVSEVIQPGLEKGSIVICDRYTDSTIAYQSYGRGLDLSTVRAVNNIASEGLKPDLTILLDLPVEVGLARKRGNADRFEKEDVSFHRRVRRGYQKLAAAEPQRWLVVDSTQPKEKAAEIIWERVSRLLRNGTD